MKTYLLSICLISFYSISLLSQKYPYKFGKVSPEEMNMKKCDFYPEAHSMVLAEKGVLNFIYDDGWKYRLVTTVRKKIFKNTESDAGDIRIRLYSPVNSLSTESISSFKAYSYNLVNGEVERTKITSKDSYDRRINDNYTEINYAIPNIKDGTVIEFQYEKVSDFIVNLATWYFQYQDVPVAYSEFNYTIPEWFNYQINQLGNEISGDWQNKNREEIFTIRYRKGATVKDNIGKGSHVATSELRSVSSNNQGIFKNIRPTLEEPFSINPSDIPSRMKFQLISVKYPNQSMEIIAGNYERFNKELLDNPSFGKKLNNGNFINDLEESLGSLTPTEKAIKIFEHIQGHFSWNNEHGYFSSSSARSAYKKGEGSVAEINISLIAALRNFNLNSYPIVLSTRGHGTVHPVYPNYNEFNYVIAGLDIEGKRILLDASSDLSFGELPLKCRNSQGWLVDDKEKGWIDLKKDSKYEVTSLINIKIDAEKLDIEITQRRKSYASFDKIDQIKEMSDEEFRADLANTFIDFEIDSIELLNVDYSKPLTLKYSLTKQNDDQELFYIKPILTGSISENPFSREKRNSPIDFPYKQKYNVITTIEVPDGYSVELPESSIIRLPNNDGEFRLIIAHSNNKVSIQSILSVQQTYFSNKDYPLVKEFYDFVSEKNNELIVLKKL